MPKLHVGTIGWSYSFWKPAFYPPKISSKDFLAYYASKFGTVEVDSTFYRIPTQQAVTRWHSQTADGFLFSAKFPRIITHIKMLRNVQAETDVFLERIEQLGIKLGVLLLQFPSSFSVARLPDLESYLSALPKNHRYVVEVRSAGWLKEEIYSLLKRSKVSLAWAERPLVQTPEAVTADFLYIRWEGDRGRVNGTLGKVEADRKADIEVWAEKIKAFLDRGIEVFGYFGKYYSGFPPSDAAHLNSLLQT